MAITPKTITKTNFGAIPGNTGMYTGANVDELFSDVIAKIEAKLTSAIHYKGSVATLDDLPVPTTDAEGKYTVTVEVGDLYNVTATGKNYIAASVTAPASNPGTGSVEWDEISGVMDLSAYKTDAQNEAKYLQIANVDTKVTELGYAKTSYVDTEVGKKQDTLSTDQLAAVNSGITATKVSGYDTHVADGDIHVTAAQKTAWTAKQDALSEAQLAAVNSGITATKVGTYDGYAATIAGKQTQLTDTQLAACDSGITAAKVSTYDGYATGKQDALTTTQLAACNSGITATKVGTYDGYATSIAGNAALLAAIAAVTMPTKDTVTVYELYDTVKAIVDAATKSES